METMKTMKEFLKPVSATVLGFGLVLFLAQQYISEKLQELDEVANKLGLVDDQLIEIHLFMETYEDLDKRLDELDKRLSIRELNRSR